jgi:hypothetical protein
MLARLAALAERFASSPWLDMLFAAPAAHMRRTVFALIVVHASRRQPKAPAPAAQTQRPRRASPGFALPRRRDSAWRIVIGARLRRRVRGKPRALIAALIALLADIETEIARMARRLHRGFTRGRAPLQSRRPRAR